jgi:hypothetical protein
VLGDCHGQGRRGVTDTFKVTVLNINDAPTLANAIADQQATEDDEFEFKVPASTFADVDAGDKLTCTATLADGSALPSWLEVRCEGARVQRHAAQRRRGHAADHG